MAATKHKVLCIQAIHPEGMKILQSRPDIELVVPESIEPQAWERHLADAEAILVRVSRIERWMIEKAPKLRIISRHGVGCDNIAVDAATEHGIVVATVGLANAPSVVEQTIAFVFALAKRLPQYDHAVRTGNYSIKFSGDSIDVAGKTILVIGLGRIGSRLVTAANAIGMTCIGVDPAYTAEQIRTMGAEPETDVRRALPKTDFVTVHCPLQPDTRNLIGAREISAMKRSSYLINCARGGVVDEAALIAALDAGTIKGAALDVQMSEPPKPDDPLLRHDRIILSPHAAASSAEGTIRMAVNSAQNIPDFFDGKLPRAHVFNPEVLAKAGS
jgi:D-3-phosphoglycerate dehydrogenase